MRTTLDNDRIVYSLHHRSSGTSYPVLLDPVVSEDQRYWFGNPPPPAPPSVNPNNDFNGWSFVSTPGGLMGGLAGAGAFGRGLNIFSSANITYPAGGAIGEWIYQAPYVPAFESEGARIIKADFGYTAHTRARNNGSTMLESIFNRQTNQSEPGGMARGSDFNGAYTPYSAPLGILVPNSEGVLGQGNTYPYRVHCLSVCSAANPTGNQGLGSPGNRVKFGLFQAAGRPIANGGAGAFMGSSLIFLTEQAGPRVAFTGAPSPTTWTKGPFTLSATVNDYGLGPRDATMTVPGTTPNVPTAVASA